MINYVIIFLLVGQSGGEDCPAIKTPQLRSKRLQHSLEFQEDGVGRTDSQASLSSPTELIPVVHISVCISVKLYFYKLSSIYVLESDVKLKDNLGMEKFDLQLVLNQEGVWIGIKNHTFPAMSTISPLKWNNLCWSLNATSHTLILYQNGEKVLETVSKKLAGNFTGGLLRNLVVGQRQSGLLDVRSSFSGVISDFNIWSYPLDDCMMKNLTACSSEPRMTEEGDLLAWSNANWNLSGVKLKSHLKESACHKKNKLYMFPEKRTFNKARHLCRIFGGIIPAPKNIKENNLFYKMSYGNFSECNRRQLEYLWIGISDRMQEGRWINESRTLHTLEGTQPPWEKEPEEPNGGRGENCAAMKKGNTWLDVKCSLELCTLCEIKETPILKLRGLCDSSPHENTYTLSGFIDGKHSFRGYYGSTIYWNKFHNYWRLDSIDKSTFAFNNRTLLYPIGLHKWYFSNETCLGKSFASMNLKFTTCKENEYTCNDGSCIKIDRKCDLKQDCQDASDESNCGLVTFYRYQQASKISPLNDDHTIFVNTSINILSLDKIQEMGMSLKIQFGLTMEWFDSRLTFHDLKRYSNGNTLSMKEKEKVWVPSYTFINTDNQDETLVDSKARMKVIRKDNFTKNPTSEVEETQIFSGKRNPIIYFRHYNIEYQCLFDMTYYPFDVQKCQMHLKPNENKGNFRVGSVKLAYSGSQDLIQYQVSGSSINSTSSEIIIMIELRRRYFCQLLTTYLPSFCVFCIIHATQYFKPSYFHTRIMVSLTGMLVMTTLFLNTTATLPKTAYFKMMDIWMVFGLLLPFIVVILHTILEYNRCQLDGERNIHSPQFIESNALAASRCGPQTQSRSNDLCKPWSMLIDGEQKNNNVYQKQHTKYSLNDKSNFVQNVSRYIISISFVVFNICYWLVALFHD